MIERTKHFGSFFIAGGSAFAVDVAVLFLLTEFLSMSPYMGQLIALWVAMTWAWWINRTWTFRVERPPSVREYVTYIASMLLSSVINYGCYVIALRAHPVFFNEPVLALFPATAVSMLVSYFGMKLIVFRKPKA